MLSVVMVPSFCEIRDVWISLANAGKMPVEQAHISLSGKNQDFVISITYEALKSALPLKPGAKVMIPVTLRAWHLGLVDTETAAGKNASGSMGRHWKEGSSPSLLIHYAGPVTNSGDQSAVPHGRQLFVPLQICILQGLFVVKACLLSMEIPARVDENLPAPVHVETTSGNELVDSENKLDKLMKIDPFRGSWGLSFLDLETSEFRLGRNNFEQGAKLKGTVLPRDMTPMEVLVWNNTSEMIKMSLSITCRDVAGENCTEGTKATVLWAGALNEIKIEVLPVQESKHCFSLYFLIPGETLC